MIERRKFVRISPKGTVILHAGELVQRGRIANLSAGGLLMETTAPASFLDEPVQVEMRVDGQTAEWLRGTGRVARHSPGTLAIVLDDVSALLLQMIDDMSRSSRMHERVMNVVLVDVDPKRRANMAKAFRAVGCIVIEASTSLEAIVRLGESSFEPDLIAIADSVAPEVAQELRAFVERDHPETKLVTIGHELVEPEGVAHWLSSIPGADLPSRVTEMLGRPRRPTQP